MKDKLLEIKDLKIHFEMRPGSTDGILPRKNRILRAVDGLSFDIKEGEILSLVGESGCGKTTTGKALLGLIKPSHGEVIFKGEDIWKYSKQQMREFRKKAQMIYQDPYQSINPRDTVADIVAEPLDVNHMVKSVDERTERVKEALQQAGMTPAEDFFGRYPHELSGGQRQRVVIASSIIMGPSFMVADEPVSMLDASIRTGILKLMMELREKDNLTYLFITHDLSLAWLVSDRIVIMYLGKIMEYGPADEIIKRGLHPYTKALTDVMPVPGLKKEGLRKTLTGETPNPMENVKGCKFNGRCPISKELCFEKSPDLREISPGHFVACHFV